MLVAEYIRNVWYMAAWEEEIVGNAVFPRALLDEKWLIYRKEDGGGYVMMADRCPHRLAPLHLGKRTGDTIACPYHGLEFGADGVCTRNPFSDVIPTHAKVGTWVAVARHGAIWFWPGDPARANPDDIPDFSALDAPTPIVRGTMLFGANYEIISDNLLDLSHVEFIHTDSFRTEGKIFQGTYDVKEADDGAVWSNWSMENTKPPVVTQFESPVMENPH